MRFLMIETLKLRAGLPAALAIVAGVVAPLAPSVAGAATPPPQDPVAYRATVLADIQEATVRSEAALAVFLDRGQSRAARLEAGKVLGTFAPPGSAKALAKVARDGKEEGEIRAFALAAVGEDGAGEGIDAAIAALAEPGAGARLGPIAVRKLQVLVQFTPRGHERRPEILAALRGAVRSDVPAVRREAIEFLAIRNDPAAIEVLEASLASRDGGPFPRPEAIALLALGDPRQHFAALRPHLGAQDPETRAAAARVLGADPASRTDLRARARGPEDGRVRAAALEALSLDDREFVALGLALAADPAEETGLREVAVRELNRRWNRNQLAPAEAERVRDAFRTLAIGPGQGPLAVRGVALDVLSVHDLAFAEYAAPLAADLSEDPALREKARAGLAREAVRLGIGRKGER